MYIGSTEPLNTNMDEYQAPFRSHLPFFPCLTYATNKSSPVDDVTLAVCVVNILERLMVKTHVDAIMEKLKVEVLLLKLNFIAIQKLHHQK